MFEIHLPSIDSTNTYAKQNVSQFPKHGITCITADHQTAGRGRFHNKWISPPNVNLYITFFFQLPLLQRDFTALGLVLASSMTKVLQSYGIKAHIKWPNDLFLKGKKFGGVLTETSVQKEIFDVFAGIGVNVNMDKEALQNIEPPATSLMIETGKQWDRKELLKKLQLQFEQDLDLFHKEGFTPFHSYCDAILAYKGEKVRCFDGKQEWIGICKSLALDGKLNVELKDHTIHALASGEIHLRKLGNHT